MPNSGKLGFIEVKGRVADATTVTVTRNEILTALNKPEDFMLAVGQVENGEGKLLYVRQLRVNVEENRLYTNRYSERCSWTTVDIPFHPEVPGLDVKAVISEAAEILKPLLINREDLEKLVSETHAQGASTWASREKKMISIIAKGGFETIRTALDRSSRETSSPSTGSEVAWL